VAIYWKNTSRTKTAEKWMGIIALQIMKIATVFDFPEMHEMHIKLL